MSSLWNFLAEEQNRTIIQWLAGGLAAAAAAIWTVIQFFYRKPEDKSPPGSPTPTNQKVIAYGKGHAAGRDVKTGVGGLNLLLIIIFVVAIAVLLGGTFGARITSAFLGSADAGLSSASFYMNCKGPVEQHPSIMTEGEFDDLVSFTDALYAHRDKLIHVSFAIERSCSACECERIQTLDEALYIEDTRVRSPDGELIEPTSAPPDNFEEVADVMSALADNAEKAGRLSIPTPDWEAKSGAVWFEGYPAPRQEYEELSVIQKEGFELEAMTSEWPRLHSYYFPRSKHLSDEQYQSGRYGFELYFDGVFISRVHEATGYVVFHLEPTSISGATKDRLSCLRAARAPTLVNRILYGC